MNPLFLVLAAVFAVIAIVLTFLGNKMERFHIVSIAFWLAVALCLLLGIFSHSAH